VRGMASAVAADSSPDTAFIQASPATQAIMAAPENGRNSIDPLLPLHCRSIAFAAP
jgi:hypothetical protein